MNALYHRAAINHMAQCVNMLGEIQISEFLYLVRGVISTQSNI